MLNGVMRELCERRLRSPGKVNLRKLDIHGWNKWGEIPGGFDDEVNFEKTLPTNTSLTVSVTDEGDARASYIYDFDSPSSGPSGGSTITGKVKDSASMKAFAQKAEKWALKQIGESLNEEDICERTTIYVLKALAKTYKGSLTQSTKSSATFVFHSKEDADSFCRAARKIIGPDAEIHRGPNGSVGGRYAVGLIYLSRKAIESLGESISRMVKVSPVTEIGLRGGPGGMKCPKCGWQGSCNDAGGDSCPKCGATLVKVGRNMPEEAEGLRGGPGGWKCPDCGWTGSCDSTEGGSCPKCGATLVKVGQSTPPAETEDTRKFPMKRIIEKVHSVYPVMASFTKVFHTGSLKGKKVSEVMGFASMESAERWLSVLSKKKEGVDYTVKRGTVSPNPAYKE